MPSLLIPHVTQQYTDEHEYESHRINTLSFQSSKQISPNNLLSLLLLLTRLFSKAYTKNSVSLTQATVPQLLLTAISV